MLGSNLLHKLSLEKELDTFLTYLCTKLNLTNQELNNFIYEYTLESKNSNSNVFLNVSQKRVQPPQVSSQPKVQSSQVVKVEPQPLPLPLPKKVQPPQTKVEPQLPSPQHTPLKTQHQQRDEIVITRFGDRFKIKTPPSILQSISNTQLKNLLLRKTISLDEFNILKNFLILQEIPFYEEKEPHKEEQKITNVEEIINKVQREIEESRKLTENDKLPLKRDKPPPSQSNASPLKGEKTKLKLVKIGTNIAWDKDSRFVFRLEKPPVAIGTRQNKDDETQELTPLQIEDLNERGWKYTIPA